MARRDTRGRVRAPARLAGAVCLAVLSLVGCTANPGPSLTLRDSPSPGGGSAPTTDASPTPRGTSGPTTETPSPNSTGGVVPADLDGFASIVARSVVAVVVSGRVEFVDRVLTDAHSSSTCVPVPAIKVRPREELGTEGAYVRHAIRSARALKSVDGVGTARGRMQPGVEWPGVDHPFVVDVIIAVDCPPE